jgi:hypothetical protein
MGFAGYVAVCIQLYCRGKLSLFYTICFGLYGHLQVCRMLLLSCSWRNLLLWFFLCILHVVTLCTWLHFCTFLYVFSCSIFLVLLCCFLRACLSACLFVLWQLTCTIKLHADGNITWNTHWTIQCSRMLKYSIKKIVLQWYVMEWKGYERKRWRTTLR